MNSESFNGIASLGKLLTERFSATDKRPTAQEKKVTNQANDCNDSCCFVSWKPIRTPEVLRNHSLAE